MSRVRANQKPDSPVSTRPLSGISVGRTTSNVEIRSLATSNRRSWSSANSSRTLPLPTWIAGASDMDRLLLSGERMQALEHGVDMANGCFEIEHGVEVDLLGDLGICGDEGAEVALFLPRLHCMPLHEAVRLIPRDARFDEREEEPVAEHEAMARVQVAAHPFGIHDEPLDDPREPVEHVVEREKCIGDDDALRRGVRDVALVPERHVLQADDGGGADDACKPADALGNLRIALVRHRGRALHPLSERLLDLAHLGAREMPDLGREPLERRGAERERREHLGVPVACDHLRRQWIGLEAELLAGDPFDFGLDLRIRADRARQLPDAVRLERGSQPRPCAVELERPPCELPAESDRLRVDPVRPADADRVPLLFGARGDKGEGALDPVEDEDAGLLDLQGKGGVDDVGRRQAEMDPAALGAELLRHGVDEGGRVVVGDALDLGDPLGRRHLRPRANRGDIVCGNRTDLGPRLECRELDVAPPRELALVRPDPGHGRAGVARDHEAILKSGQADGPRIRAARTAAFFALSTPTHATGTPGGICTIDSNASSPSSTLFDDRKGTPITGRSVCAATAPGSAAARPAPAIRTRRPRSRAPFAYSATASG